MNHQPILRPGFFFVSDIAQIKEIAIEPTNADPPWRIKIPEMAGMASSRIQQVMGLIDMPRGWPAKLLFLSFLAVFGGCSPEPDPVIERVQQPESPSTFACGDQRCSIAREYCYRVFPAAVQPGSRGYSESCQALPHPDCSEVERSGKCIGSADSGITIEVYFP